MNNLPTYIKEAIEGLEKDDPRFINLNYLTMENLQMLEICQGIIEAIPASIQQLQNLEYLYLVDTQIDEIDLNMLRVFLPETDIRFKAGF